MLTNYVASIMQEKPNAAKHSLKITINVAAKSSKNKGIC